MDAFRYLRVRREPQKVVSEPGALTVEQLAGDPALPITLRQINDLPDNVKQRVYRALLPSDLLARFEIDMLTWKRPGGNIPVRLKAQPETGLVNLSIHTDRDPSDEFLSLELGDNALNGIDLNFIQLGDPSGPRFGTDVEGGRATLFGTARRNLAEEERAMRAGLAPAQVRPSLGGSKMMLQHLEAFLAALGHRAYFLEPLTYASAWIFERRGLAYVRGHKLMDDIHVEFQPGGRLHQALDGSTPFRQPEQAPTVRGRAWAIHDGILEVIGATWNDLRMVKRVGRHAGVETFPGAAY